MTTALVRRALPSAAVAAVPALYAPTPQAAKRFIEYFAANIRNPNTRRAYFHAVREFSSWCEAPELHGDRRYRAAACGGLHRAARRHGWRSRRSSSTWRRSGCSLTGWSSARSWPPIPAAPVRGPKYTVKKGKTPVLTQEEARELLDSIDASTVVGLRDRALIATMIYTFGRVGAVIKMRVEDYYTQGRRGWVRLHEKGGKRHEMPCNHNLEAYLDAYINAAGIAGDFKGYLFRTVRGQRPSA